MAASFAVGACSVMPQIFIPIAAQYSRPEKKGANVGLIRFGITYRYSRLARHKRLVGEWLGWRAMYFIAAIVMSLCTLVVWRIMPYTENNYTGSYKRLMHSLFALIREYKLLRICALRRLSHSALSLHYGLLSRLKWNKPRSMQAVMS